MHRHGRIVILPRQHKGKVTIRNQGQALTLGRMHRVKRVMLACLLWLGGCHYLKSVDIPLTAETYHHEPGNKQLIILLHGLGGSAGNFQKYGVVTQLRDCAPDAKPTLYDLVHHMI